MSAIRPATTAIKSQPTKSPVRSEVLVVNSDPEVRVVTEKVCFIQNLDSVVVNTPDEAQVCLRRQPFAFALVAIESVESLNLLRQVARDYPATNTVAVGQAATPELVRDVMRTGARDFIFGDLNTKTLLERFKSALTPPPVDEDHRNDANESSEARDSGVPAEIVEVRSDSSSANLICRNEKMRRVLEMARRVAPSNSTALIQGESGTGKELIARWIHDHSARAENAFVAVNCGALPENLLESQLFGHEKGSFTGAFQRQIGLFEIADGGTIFLDEVAEMGLNMQVKLLRVLQFKEFRRIGGSRGVKVNVRVLAATNRDVKVEMEQGRFRSDLYYRLNVISLELPPLRERREEIPELIDSFCKRFGEVDGLHARTFSPAAVEAMQKFRWEGNIRELENAVERLLLLSDGDIVEVSDVEEHLQEQQPDMALDSELSTSLTLDEVKRLHIARVLRQNDGNKMKTARMLQINVKTLYNLIKSLDIVY